MSHQLLAYEGNLSLIQSHCGGARRVLVDGVCGSCTFEVMGVNND